jgi:hypothetical protein
VRLAGRPRSDAIEHEPPRTPQILRSNDAPTVVGIFPNPAALLLLSSCVLIEAHDEWQDSGAATASLLSLAQQQATSYTTPRDATSFGSGRTSHPAGWTH